MQAAKLPYLKSGLGRTIEVNGKQCLFFGGTAYLGIPGNAHFQALVWDGIKRYGVNHGASRLNNVTLEVYHQAEKEAAKRCQAEDAILVSSGYLAAQLVIQHFSASHQLLYATDTHPALWIGKPKLPSFSYRDWVEQTLVTVNKNGVKPYLLVTNSLNNLFPEHYAFDWLERINSNKKVTLLVDDSHGMGITGENGQGIYHSIPKFRNVEVIVAASMAKGLGVDAGAVLGSKEQMESLRKSPIYAGSSPPSPAMLYAYLNAEEIYCCELQKLKQNTQLFSGLTASNPAIKSIAGFPIFLLDDDAIYNRLPGEIVISSFPYPDAAGKPVNRVVISSVHEEKDLKRLAGLFNSECPF